MIANVYVIGYVYSTLLQCFKCIMFCFTLFNLSLTKASRDDPPFISVGNEANPLENDKLDGCTGERSHIDCSQEGNHSINPLINNQYTP